MVISQDPAASTSVDHNSSVTVTISQGREPITVPTTSGLAKDDAVATIEAAGLVASVEEDYSTDVEAGVVISQSPSNGTLYRGDTVTITVSRGPKMVDVPNVIGMSESAAKKALTDAGFVVKTENALWVVLGQVYSQSPSGGTQAPEGSTITIKMV